MVNGSVEGTGPMAIQSLQKIISLENELSAAEEAERQKVALWLKEQEAEILRRYGEDLAALEGERRAARGDAENTAKKQAAALLQQAQKRAALYDGLDDSDLQNALKDIRHFVSGQGS